MFPNNQSSFGIDQRTAGEKGLDGMVTWAAAAIALLLTPELGRFAAPYAEQLATNTLGQVWAWVGTASAYVIAAGLSFNLGRASLAMLAALALAAGSRWLPALV